MEDGPISMISEKFTINKRAFFFGGYNQEPYEFIHNMPINDLVDREVFNRV